MLSLDSTENMARWLFPQPADPQTIFNSTETVFWCFSSNSQEIVFLRADPISPENRLCMVDSHEFP